MCDLIILILYVLFVFLPTANLFHFSFELVVYSNGVLKFNLNTVAFFND